MAAAVYCHIGRSASAVEEGHEEEEEVTDLEPFFFDEAEAVADHQKRLLREEEALRKEQLIDDRFDRVTDYDPEFGCRGYTRFGFNPLDSCDPDEESPLGPMRYTDEVYEEGLNDPNLRLYPGVNVFSVKMVTLDDLKFPIHVYGTVIARDSLDRMCVYLFRTDEDHCQVINSESESLILTGPNRGLLLISDIFIEIDLKIKDSRSPRDTIQLSKGFLSVRGISLPRLTNVVESKSLESKLSTVEVMYAVVNDAVEATIAIEVLSGEFSGEITACTSSIPDSLVLHNSKTGGDGGEGTIQLFRSIITVNIKEMLIISAKTGDGKFERTTDFTPRLNGWEDDVVSVGTTRMRVKVTWSTIY